MRRMRRFCCDVILTRHIDERPSFGYDDGRYRRCAVSAAEKGVCSRNKIRSLPGRVCRDEPQGGFQNEDRENVWTTLP